MTDKHQVIALTIGFLCMLLALVLGTRAWNDAKLRVRGRKTP